MPNPTLRERAEKLCVYNTPGAHPQGCPLCENLIGALHTLRDETRRADSETCIKVWKDEKDLTTQNELAAGCLASSEAILNQDEGE